MSDTAATAARIQKRHATVENGNQHCRITLPTPESPGNLEAVMWEKQAGTLVFRSCPARMARSNVLVAGTHFRTDPECTTMVIRLPRRDAPVSNGTYTALVHHDSVMLPYFMDGSGERLPIDETPCSNAILQLKTKGQLYLSLPPEVAQSLMPAGVRYEDTVSLSVSGNLHDGLHVHAGSFWSADPSRAAGYIAPRRRDVSHVPVQIRLGEQELKVIDPGGVLLTALATARSRGQQIKVPALAATADDGVRIVSALHSDMAEGFRVNTDTPQTASAESRETAAPGTTSETVEDELRRIKAELNARYRELAKRHPAVRTPVVFESDGESVVQNEAPLDTGEFAIRLRRLV